MDEIRRHARRDRLTVGVRRVLREARSRQPVHDPQVKLKAVRRAVAHLFPTGDIEQMLAETARRDQT